MIIRKHGITLHRLSESDIELVRTKRNAEHIRRAMFFRDVISPEQQQQWFQSVNNIFNYYFIIEFEGQKIGLINGKKIDYGRKITEGGIFIWEEKYWSGFVPALASVVMADLTFIIMNFEKTFAEVRTDNPVALLYNKFLGYTVHTTDLEHQKQTLVLTKENYLSRASKIREAVQKISKDNSHLSWNNFDFSTVTEAQQSKLYSNLPPFLQHKADELINAHRTKF